MASPFEGWDDQQMLDQYLHDYFIKRKLHKTAAIFREQANVAAKPVEINDSAQGFLYDWWTMFYDVYVYRQCRKGQNVKGKAPVNVMDEQTSQNEKRNACQIVPQFAINLQRHGQSPSGSDFDMILRQPGASLIATRMFEEQFHPVRNYDPQLQAFDVNKLNLSNSASAILSYLPLQAQQLLRDNRDGISIGGAGPSRINPNGAQRGMGDGWLSPNHQQTFPLLTQQYQSSLLVQALSHTSKNLKFSSPSSPTNFQGQSLILPKSDLNMKDAQMRIQMKQTQEKQNQLAQCLEQQLTENDRKRKRLPYSRAEEQTSDFANAEEDKPANENVIESFLSTDDDHGDGIGTPFSTLKRRSTACSENDHKGFTFEEIGCLSSSKSKVLCCHFSSDGKMLASSGHDKKVSIWNMEDFQASNSSEEHSLLVTDVRFRPSSSIFATASFDKTVRIWDAAKPSISLFKLLGHAEQVMSLDFHPRKVDLLSSCDGNDEIRLWNVNKRACMRVSKGATRQVRFQPTIGKLMATSTGNSINVIDVEVGNLVWNLKGHSKEVLSICWDTSGKCIASVSEDSARVWSLVDGKCLGKLHSNGNKFQSCAFHPGYSVLLIIGGYQVLEFWSPADGGKSWSIPAHGGLIAALADSVENEMIASASHDHCVKLWK
ncbi:PREDICTED: transcriptional corepressor LEUNIG-like isoform X1 [Populus euphratica]|uniref:Transcriptional corepressor LEUNIG-like isoform X1 n=1 Tax=Populus euphratica TaxID=75702 RepID=A0AAJ6XR03_POPEU|nr:PREDICTED: transcriptional corepressor LEUNIG-like isoform X1 [Populus euphratica]XP_011027807.1 PREDICTED: transcriptional corepressor LEUNIG-like isoform X1 [Populus euphratica]